MARRFRNPATGHVVTTSDSATDEQIGIQIRRESEEYDRSAKEAAATRQQGMAAMEEFMGPQGPEMAGPEVPQIPPQMAASPSMAPQTAQVAPGRAIPPEGAAGAPTAPQDETPGLFEFLGRAAAGPLAGPSLPFWGPGTPEEQAAYQADTARQQRGFKRHVPSIVAGTVAAGLTGGGSLAPSLLARLGIQAGAGAVGEATGAALTGEDPYAAGGKGALYGLLGETGGTLAGKAIPKVLAPFRKDLSKEAMAAQAVLEPLGGKLTPGQMSESRILSFMENVAKGGIAAGRRVQTQQKHTVDVAQDLMQAYRQSYPEKGGVHVKSLYAKAEAMMKGSTVDLASVAQKAKALVEQDKGRSPAITKLAGWLDDLGTKAIPSGPGPTGFTAAVGRTPAQKASYVVSFEDARRLRTDLLKVTRDIPGELATGKAHGAAKTLVKDLHGLMDVEAQVAGPQAHAAWRLADETFKQAKFGNFVQRLGEQSKKGGQVRGEHILDALDRMPQARKEIFDPVNMAALREFANVLKVAQRKDPEGTGKMWITLVQGTAAGAALTTGFTPAAGVILGGPRVLAWALTNPKTAKWLTTGFRVPGSEESTRAIGLLLGQMAGRGMGESGEAEAGEAEYPWEQGWTG